MPRCEKVGETSLEPRSFLAFSSALTVVSTSIHPASEWCHSTFILPQTRVTTLLQWAKVFTTALNLKRGRPCFSSPQSWTWFEKAPQMTLKCLSGEGAMFLSFENYYFPEQRAVSLLGSRRFLWSGSIIVSKVQIRKVKPEVPKVLTVRK